MVTSWCDRVNYFLARPQNSDVNVDSDDERYERPRNRIILSYLRPIHSAAEGSTQYLSSSSSGNIDTDTLDIGGRDSTHVQVLMTSGAAILMRNGDATVRTRSGKRPG